MRRKPRERAPKPRWRKSRLEDLVHQAVGDAPDEEEAQAAFFEILETRVAYPFRVRLDDGPAVVRGIELGEDDEVLAVCRRPDGERRVPLLEVPIPRPAPKGAEWIEAWRLWLSE